MIAGYRVPGLPQGRAFNLPDSCYGKFTQEEADGVAERLRDDLGCEPTWQKVRGELLRLVRRRSA